MQCGIWSKCAYCLTAGLQGQHISNLHMFLIFVIVVNVRIDLPPPLESKSILACWTCKFFLWPTFLYWDCCPWSSEVTVVHLRVISFTPIISNPTWSNLSRQKCCFDIVRRGFLLLSLLLLVLIFWFNDFALSSYAVVFVLIVLSPLNIYARTTNPPPLCPHWPPIWMLWGHLLVMTASPVCISDSTDERSHQMQRSRPTGATLWLLLLWLCSWFWFWFWYLDNHNRLLSSTSIQTQCSNDFINTCLLKYHYNKLISNKLMFFETI